MKNNQSYSCCDFFQKALACLIILTTAIFFNAHAQANDDCSGAIEVFCGEVITGSTSAATVDGIPDCNSVTNTSPGVWYSFTGTGDFVTISTCNNATFDTKISVFTDGCGTLTCVGSNDDGPNCSGFTSEFGFASSLGNQYLLLIHGYQSETGSFTLGITCTVEGNDNCSDATPVSCGQTLNGSTTGATADAAPDCNGVTNASPGVWYSFTGTGDIVTISTCNNATFDTKISVFTDGCGTLTCVAANDDGAGCSGFTSKVKFVSTPGVEYLILVHGYQNDTGDFSLAISCSPVLPPPPNDNCTDITPANTTNETTVTFTGTTAGATATPDEASLLGAAVVWEAVTLSGECNNLTVDYCGTTPVPANAVIVYTDCPATTFTSGIINQTACPDGNVTINFYNLPAGTYYLPVLADEGSTALGDYTMNVVSLDCPPPPANDNVCAAESLTLGLPTAFNNLSATAEPGEVSPGAGTGTLSCNADDGWCLFDTAVQNSVWYYFTVPASGHVIVAAEGVEGQLAVYTAGNCGDFGSYTEVGANDDSNPSCQFCPLADLKCLIPGATYYVQLDGFDGARGTGTIMAIDGGLTDVVTGYTLVNSATDLDIGPLLEGDIINLHNFPPFTIRANTCRPIGSVKFEMNGAFTRIENFAPYSFSGENNGDYEQWNATPGAYQLVATPYIGADSSGGLVGLPSLVNFTVIDEDCSVLEVLVTTDAFGEETSWELVDITDNTNLGSVAQGTLGANTSYRNVFCIPTSHCIEFRIFDSFSDGICCNFGNGSYMVKLAGQIVITGGSFGDSEIKSVPSSFGNVQVSICEGDSYFAGGADQTEAGFYIDTLFYGASNGCDSILTTELIVLPNSFSNVQATICSGESYFAGGDFQTESGIYYDTLTSANGCDSIVTTELIVRCDDGNACTADACSDGICVFTLIQCNGNVVEVNQNVTVNFNTSPPAYTGDPDLLPYFTYDNSGPAANTWKAIFNLGSNKLVVKNGATITVTNVPNSGNNQYAPGIVINSKCEVEVENGGHIVVNSLNRNAGDIYIQAGGNILINGEIRNQVSGTNGLPGAITVISAGGDLMVGSTGLVQILGVDAGGNLITLNACGNDGDGDIVISGLVKSFAAAHAGDLTLNRPNIKVVTLNGRVTVNANTTEPLYDEFLSGGTRYDIWGGLLSWVSTNVNPGKVEVQAKGDITVNGHGTDPTTPVRESFGAIAAIATASNAPGGWVEVISLEGKIVGNNRAFDVSGRNRLSTNFANIRLSSKLDISLNRLGSNNNFNPVVDASSPSVGDKGGKNTLRSFSGKIIVGTNAQVSAAVPAGSGTVQGINLLSSCLGVTNGGTVTPVDLNAGDDNGTCSPAPEALFTECPVICDFPYAKMEEGGLNASGNNDINLTVYPNPFNDQLTFEFSVPDDSQILLEMFSITGEKIATVFEGKVVGGQINKQVFYARGLASGLYLYRMKTRDSVVTERVMLVR